ncbi:MAG: hypothetical protein NT033_09375 [Candidatus Omnitrophica bacterium]|nr:hypothetical protein [Candidatus Omnitrophota bacterium]
MRNNFLLLGLIFLVAFLRLYGIRYMELKYDEALVSFSAVDLTHKNSFPLVGARSSQGAASGSFSEKSRCCECDFPMLITSGVSSLLVLGYFENSQDYFNAVIKGRAR